MRHQCILLTVLFVLLFSTLGAARLNAQTPTSARRPAVTIRTDRQRRWLFIWRDMSDPKEVDRMIARFPRAHADGYNGVCFAAGALDALTAIDRVLEIDS